MHVQEIGAESKISMHASLVKWFQLVHSDPCPSKKVTLCLGTVIQIASF